MCFRNLRRGGLSPEEKGHFSLVFWTLATRTTSTYISVFFASPSLCWLTPAPQEPNAVGVEPSVRTWGEELTP